jgi:hypothetical protein
MIPWTYAAAVERVGQPLAPQAKAALPPGPGQVLVKRGGYKVRDSDIRRVGVADAR